MPARLLLTVFLLAFTSSSAWAQVSATPPPVRADSGMVVAAERHAAEAGLDVLRAGGNAVDAAVATGFALAVTFPVA
ncbi:MAG: gamma-glutamyltransferase, partial [Bacteroidota bacterium]